MKILIINGDFDSAGVGYLLAENINRYSKYSARQICAVKTLFPVDILLENADYDEVMNLIEQADILHFNNVGYEIPFGKIKWQNYIKNKKIIFHAHSIHEKGGILYNHFKRGFLYHKFDCYDKVVVCAPCNTWIYNNSVWMPNVVPVYSKLNKFYIPKAQLTNNIVIGQSPTGRERKNTNDLEMVYKNLKNYYQNIELLLIEGLHYEKCLELKAKTNIFFDNMFQGHHGMSGFEAMALGIPLISYLKSEIKNVYREFADGEDIPVLNVKNSEELYYILVDLLNNKEKMLEIGNASRNWILKYYNEKSIIKKWIKLYDSI